MRQRKLVLVRKLMAGSKNGNRKISVTKFRLSMSQNIAQPTTNFLCQVFVWINKNPFLKYINVKTDKAPI